MGLGCQTLGLGSAREPEVLHPGSLLCLGAGVDLLKSTGSWWLAGHGPSHIYHCTDMCFVVSKSIFIHVV